MDQISIIIPAYNVEKYLERCLESVLKQTYQNYEIILINDGSIDKTESIALSYKKKYPDLFQVMTVENGGQGRARNIGLDMAKGSYISFIDSDDFIKPDMLEKMIKKAKETDADIVTCNYMYGVDPDGYNLVVPKVAKNQRDMFIDPDVSPCNKLYRASVLQDYHIRFPEGMFYEDITFYYMYIPYIRKIASIQEPFYYYVIHGYSSTHGKQDNRVKDIFPVMDIMVDYFKQKGYYDRFQDEIEYSYVKILLCSNMGRICQIEDKSFKRKMMYQTLKKIHNRFPEYKKNKYMQHGVKAFYMRHVSKWNIKICAFLMNRLSIHQR